MKSFILSAVFLVTAFLTHAQQAAFTQTIRGTVIDEQSGTPLHQASISIDGAQGSGTSISDSLGNFKLKGIAIGRRTIRASYTGYEPVTIANIEVTSSHEVVIEIKMKERIKKQDEVIVNSGKPKNRALNDAALVSARQLSIDEAFRYAGTRSDPSRMAQNFAGVSGSNDARNDIIIRGNSPAGVLWRMDGIDIPNPNHFSTLGSTGGPVSILNTNTLKNSDFLTGAFPAQYGNALAGVFDLRMRNGNNEKNEYLVQTGFNGFEFGAEGPLDKKTRSSFLVDYRYSMVATLQSIGFNFGTGNATPYYQDATFKINMPTKKAGTFSIFGLGGESHIHFSPESQEKDNLYATNDGSTRDRNFKSLTGVVGLGHTYFFNPFTSGKATFAISGFKTAYDEVIVDANKPGRTAYDKNNVQVKYSFSYTLNKKFSPQNQLTAGVVAEDNQLSLRQDYIKNGDSVLTNLFDTKENTLLLKGFTNWAHRFSDRLSSNTGIYAQLFTLNQTYSVEPRWNIRYQLKPNQSISFGAGLHSQLQPLEVYFYKSTTAGGQTLYTNHDLDFTKSLHGVAGYDISFSRHLRFKAEVYAQYIYDVAVEKLPSSFSMLNSGADFAFPDKTDLINNGKGYNYGLELTVEKFLHKGLYYLFTGTLFQSKYKASDNVWRNTAFNSNYVLNFLGGKEWTLNKKTAFSIDTKLTITGGQRYTPFNIPASKSSGYVIYQEELAYSEQQKRYLRWDLKFSYTRNLKKITQKWYVDFQNLTDNRNIYIRTLNPKTGAVGEINQIGFFPNINYQLTF